MTPTVPTDLDRTQLTALYERTEQEYFHSLPLEHFMESVPHATQRKITVQSFDVIHTYRPDIQCFNELLIQYPLPGRPLDKPGQVVPDNMVVVHAKPIEAKGNYTTILQPVKPTLVLEYVSKSSRQKDHEDNFAKYEKELKAPYYLLFDPDAIELILYRLSGSRYQAVRPNAEGRCPISEMDLEVGLHEEWVRYWFRGALVPLAPELRVELDETKAERDAMAKALKKANRALEAERQGRETERQGREAERQGREAERQAREAAEAELAKLREELARARKQS